MNEKSHSSGPNDPFAAAASSPTGGDAGVDPTPSRSHISFDYDAEANKLNARLTPAMDAPAISLGMLRNRLRQEGYGEYFFDEGALQQLVDRAAKAESGTVAIAECRDGEVHVHVASNKLAVHLDIIAPFGGEPVSLDQVNQALAEHSISTKCQLETEIKKAVEQSAISNALVAKALPPVPGKDVEFVTLVSEEESKIPEEGADGSIDLHEVRNYLVVDAGTHLMRRIPPTAGEPGTNVLGEEIAPEPGRDEKFSKECMEGAALDEEDENLLVAAIKGHPVIMRQGVKIDPTLNLKGVNITTGNIDFDGSVNVRRGVESGYEIKATGDVFVSDIVDKAVIAANGNIVINGGVIGDEQESQQAEPKARLTAEGSISAKFVNLAKLEAGADIDIREYVIHSHLYAKGEIRLGQGGGKGCIIGGETHADQGIVANVLGSDAYVVTHVSAGLPHNLSAQCEMLKKDQRRRNHEREQLLVILSRLMPDDIAMPAEGPRLEKIRKVNAGLTALDKALTNIVRQIQEVEHQMSRDTAAYVETKRRLYPNVAITIDGVSATSEKEKKMIKLVRRGSSLKPVE